jgi:hypothetical protein
MPCDEWTSRVESYKYAVQAYNEAVLDLCGAPGLDFNQSWQMAERARKLTDNARAALLVHEHQHACVLTAGVAQMPVLATEDFILGDQGQSGG